MSNISWSYLIASLWLKTHTITWQDFFELNDFSLYAGRPEKLFEATANLALRDYLQKNPRWCQEAEIEIQVLLKNHAKILHPLDANYPFELQNLDRPPLFLSYWGEAAWLGREKLAVVGSRDPSLESLQWMDQHLQNFLKQKPVTLVSGAARGIDQKAHAMSLRANLPTLALLPSGLGSVYPQNFRAWVKPILAGGGAIISEYNYAQEMRKHFFQQRNRLITAFGKSLFVVEARRKSGSLLSARYAVEQGKNILILPSSPTQESRWGSLDLLYDGAFPIRDYQDLLQVF